MSDQCDPRAACGALSSLPGESWPERSPPDVSYGKRSPVLEPLACESFGDPNARLIEPVARRTERLRLNRAAVFAWVLPPHSVLDGQSTAGGIAYDASASAASSGRPCIRGGGQTVSPGVVRRVHRARSVGRRRRAAPRLTDTLLSSRTAHPARESRPPRPRGRSSSSSNSSIRRRIPASWSRVSCVCSDVIVAGPHSGGVRFVALVGMPPERIHRTHIVHDPDPESERRQQPSAAHHHA